MHCSIMGYSSQICDKIFKVLLVTYSVDWFLQKQNPLCLCVWDLTWIGSEACRVPMLPCIINHLQRRIRSLLLQSWRSRACSHTAVSLTQRQKLPPVFSLLYYYSWYSGPNEVAENGERKKCPRGQIHTDTLRQVQVYKCRSSEHQRFFLTSKMLLHWNMVGDQYVCSNYLISAIDINDSYSLYKKQKS